MVNISDKAAKQINHLLLEDDQPDSFLRIKVEKGGCSGYSYSLDFEKDRLSSDKVFESNGARIIVDTESLLYLLGMTLDFDGGLNGQGFTFSNPNASKTCSCGSSFNV